MFNYLLNSGGKDSNFISYKKKFLNLFIKIDNDCYNFIDEKFSFINCKIIKKKKYFIKFKKRI